MCPPSRPPPTEPEPGPSNAEREREREREIISAYASLLPLLRQIARSRGVKAEDLDDVVHDVFLRVLPLFWTGRTDVIGLPYLAKAVRNASLDRGKGDQVRARHAALVRSLGSPPTPEDELVESELFDRYEKAVFDLPQRAREAYVNVEIEGLSIAETADVMDITKKAVERGLGYARRALRERLVGSDDRWNAPASGAGDGETAS
jgi:RNA polymerase sigma-70 factor (ECF subfamily)